MEWTKTSIQVISHSLAIFIRRYAGFFGKVGHREEGAPFEYIVSRFLLEVITAQGSTNCLLLSRVFHS